MAERAVPATPRTGRGSKPRVNVAERREAYIRIASRVFLERGLGAATMQDVADAAGVPKVLFYRIFSSKKNLLDAILDHVIQGIHEVYAKPLRVYGDGSNVRDWLHVEDHAAGLLRLLSDGILTPLTTAWAIRFASSREA